MEYLNQEQVTNYVKTHTIYPIVVEFMRSGNSYNCLPFENNQVIHLDIGKIQQLENSIERQLENKPLGLTLDDGVYTYIMFKCGIEEEFIFLYEKVVDILELLTKHSNYLNYCENENNILVYVAGEFRKTDDLFKFNFASGTFMKDVITSENREKYKGLVPNAFPNLLIDFTNEDTNTFIDDEFKNITSDNPLYHSHYKENSTLFENKDECTIYKTCNTYCKPPYSKAPKYNRHCGEHCPQRKIFDELIKGGKTRQIKKKTKANKNKKKTNKNKKIRKINKTQKRLNRK